MCASLVLEHYKALSPFVPNKIKKDGHVISYEYVEGKTLYERNDNIGNFAMWCFDNLWKYSSIKATGLNRESWYSTTPIKIISNFSSKDVFRKVNNIIEKNIDVGFVPARIHGDLHPLNVIILKDENYILSVAVFDGNRIN